jgi:hypothetical protein
LILKTGRGSSRFPQASLFGRRMSEIFVKLPRVLGDAALRVGGRQDPLTFNQRVLGSSPSALTTSSP